MSTFQENARVLLGRSSRPGEVLAAVRALEREFGRVTGVHDGSEDPEHGRAMSLPTGTAIAPREAARCLLDFRRTRTFLRGIRAAIEEAGRRFGATRIEVLYAGCGPWAPLALPLCTVFGPERVGFRLLDAQPRSLQAAETLVGHLGLDEWIVDFVQGDATTIRLDRPPHVVVAETMQRALAREPQLALTAHLAPQLAAGGIFVPEHVRVELCVADAESEAAADPASEAGEGSTGERVWLGRLMDLAPSRASSILATARDGLLPPEKYFVPALPEGRRWQAMILTGVTVFAEHALGDYDSGVTYPEMLDGLGELRGGEAIEVRYRLGADPGFAARIAREPVVRDATDADAGAILALNRESEHLLSPMDADRLARLRGWSARQRVVEVDGTVVGFLLALPSGTAYDSANYRWFDESRAGFLYVDRIVIGREHRGRGLASTLYDDLFAFAREEGVAEIACEFDVEPPNPASRVFHASYGFGEVGARELGEGRTVSMQVAQLRPR